MPKKASVELEVDLADEVPAEEAEAEVPTEEPAAEEVSVEETPEEAPEVVVADNDPVAAEEDFAE